MSERHLREIDGHATASAIVKKWSELQHQELIQQKERQKFTVEAWQASETLMRQKQNPVCPDWRLVRFLGKAIDHFESVAPPEATGELTRRDEVDFWHLCCIFKDLMKQTQLEAKFGQFKHEFAYECSFAYLDQLLKEDNPPPQALVAGLSTAANAIFLVVVRRWVDALRAIVCEVEEITTVEDINGDDVVHLQDAAKAWASEVLAMEADWPDSLRWTTVLEYPCGLFCTALDVTKMEWWDFTACYGAIGALTLLEARLYEHVPEALRQDRGTSFDTTKVKTISQLFEDRRKKESDDVYTHTMISKAVDWKRIEYGNMPDLETYVEAAIRSETIDWEDDKKNLVTPSKVHRSMGIYE